MDENSNIVQVVRERIADKAFEFYEQRGRIYGHDVDDWLEAERVILTELLLPGLKKAKPSRRKSAPSKSDGGRPVKSTARKRASSKPESRSRLRSIL